MSAQDEFTGSYLYRDYNSKDKRMWFKLNMRNYSELEEVIKPLLMVLYGETLDYHTNKNLSKFRERAPCTVEELGKIQSNELMDVVIKQNMMDISKNRKPPGFNYGPFPKLMFPIINEGDYIEFYLETHKNGLKFQKKMILFDRLTNILRNKGIDFMVLEDRIEKSLDLLDELEKV